MQAAQPVLIYDRIATNHRRALLLMAAFFSLVALPQFVVITIVVALLPAGAKLLAIVVAATALASELSLFAYFGYRWADRVALRIAGATRVQPDQEPELARHLGNLCIGAGLPLPSLFVIEDDAPNAMSTGRDPRHASIAVTRGLLTQMEPRELEGVLAHELCHIGNHDTLLMTAIVFCVWVLSYVPDHLFVYEPRDYSRTSAAYRGSNPLIGAVVYMTIGPFALLVGMLARLVGFAASRERECLADASAVLLTRNPEGIVHALRKARDAPAVLRAATGAAEPLFFVGPPRAANLFLSTHPTIPARLEALRRV